MNYERCEFYEILNSLLIAPQYLLREHQRKTHILWPQIGMRQQCMVVVQSRDDVLVGRYEVMKRTITLTHFPVKT
jgi:hypothetical protein